MIAPTIRRGDFFERKSVKTLIFIQKGLQKPSKYVIIS